MGMGMGRMSLLRGRTILPSTIRNFSVIGRSATSTRSTPFKFTSYYAHRNLPIQTRSYSIQNPGATNPTSIPSQQHPTTTTTTNSSSSNSNSGPESEPQPTGAYAKFKLLAKKYGWYAIGMYSLLSAFDFSLSFLVVHSLGAERIEPLISTSLRTYRTWRHGPEETKRLEEEDKVRREEVKNEQKAKGGYWGSRMFWAEILLAYTIHKTLLLPFRAGLTVAWTPKVVNWLRARGWAGKVSRLYDRSILISQFHNFPISQFHHTACITVIHPRIILGTTGDMYCVLCYQSALNADRRKRKRASRS